MVFARRICGLWQSARGMSVLVVGSIALDHIKTPLEEHQNLLGGSASYACVAASFYSPVNLVGIVGEDFPKEHIELFKRRNVDLAGLQIVPGKRSDGRANTCGT